MCVLACNASTNPLNAPSSARTKRASSFRCKREIPKGASPSFQEQLEGLRLKGVSVRLTIGGADTIVDPKLPGFDRVAENLKASRATIPNATHDSIVDDPRTLDRVSRGLRR